MKIKVEIEITGLDDWGIDWSDEQERDRTLRSFKRDVEDLLVSLIYSEDFDVECKIIE